MHLNQFPVYCASTLNASESIRLNELLTEMTRAVWVGHTDAILRVFDHLGDYERTSASRELLYQKPDTLTYARQRINIRLLASARKKSLQLIGGCQI